MTEYLLSAGNVWQSLNITYRDGISNVSKGQYERGFSISLLVV